MPNMYAFYDVWWTSALNPSLRIFVTIILNTHHYQIPYTLNGPDGLLLSSWRV
jgi:hypothetical protein